MHTHWRTVQRGHLCKCWCHLWKCPSPPRPREGCLRPQTGWEWWCDCASAKLNTRREPCRLTSRNAVRGFSCFSPQGFSAGGLWLNVTEPVWDWTQLNGSEGNGSNGILNLFTQCSFLTFLPLKLTNNGIWRWAIVILSDSTTFKHPFWLISPITVEWTSSLKSLFIQCCL